MRIRTSAHTCVLIVAGAPSLLGGVVRAQTEPIPAQMARYETAKLAEGIYLFQPPVIGEAAVTGNSVVVIGDDGVLVVDSGHFPSLTKRQIEDIRGWTDKPVRYLVITHWHPDHNAGNGAYRGAFPGIQIVSTAATRDGIVNTLPKKEVSEQDAERYGQIATRGVGPDGKALTPAALAYWKRVSPEMAAFVPELRAANHLPPNVTFASEMTVYLGKREVRILFLGRGNTAGDAIVYVPDAKLVAAGDLVVSPIPYPFGSFIGEWIETLAKLDDLDFTTLVPGHGPVMHDKQYLERVIALLRETKRQTDAAFKSGLSLAETHKKVDVSAMKPQFAGDDPAKGFFFDQGYLTVAVQRAYREAKEGPLKDED